jgi:hypothetical protein
MRMTESTKLATKLATKNFFRYFRLFRMLKLEVIGKDIGTTKQQGDDT